ncbi:MAG: von Willebrand factor type A domain-containing protein [Chitinophagales bacterium]|nr:von Willebrand factor type A domain-containing protein [Chitinophagaceae bacterium]MCB9064762.1 von Willebrand factor type A domain-containing protein [Chitinophagales bacterium]
MKRLITLLAIVVGISTLLIAQGQSGSIIGKVVDENNEPVINAEVQILQGDVEKGTSITDKEGNYNIKPISPGRYDLKISYTGYKEDITKGVIVSPDKITEVNIKLVPKSKLEAEGVVIKEYKIPLIDKYSVKATKTSEEIEAMPTRNTTQMLSTAPGIYNSNDGRGDGTLYIVDGVQVYGSRGINLAQGAIDQVEVQTNGRSAKYGDATGGVYKYETPLMEMQSPPPPSPKQPPIYLNPSVESYKKNPENDFKDVVASPLSTLSIDVDRASYSNIRRFIKNRQMPPVDAVRIEEMVNYFDYDYPQPKGEHPIAIVTELTECPWNSKHQLLHIGMQAKKMDVENLPPSNLVFLIDVSGSMSWDNKLPLVVKSLKLLTQNLREQDKISIVVYAGNAGLVLEPTSGSNKQKIFEALDRLQSGGSTAGGEGILLAYRTAQKNYIKGGNNRIVLATDGDFNVGMSGDNEMEDLITKEREKGIFLTCLGYGMGNYKDSKLEVLADKGNGNYAYIDNIDEAKKTLVKEFGGTIFTIAKDVKTQIEFNPSKVKGYRLVGYENRILNAEDFIDDTKDAGEMGAGHTVTIIYELIPTGVRSDDTRAVDGLKYQHQHVVSHDDELATIKFRYKKPDGDRSTEMQHVVRARESKLNNAPTNVRFATSVAMFGMLLKDSDHKGAADYNKVLALAQDSKGTDKDGYRAEFLSLVETVRKRTGKDRNRD